MHVRSGEPKLQNYFRCDRYFQTNGQWHFTTREQTVEGPFRSRAKAEAAVMRYIDMISCRMFNVNEQNIINSLKVVF